MMPVEQLLEIIVSAETSRASEKEMARIIDTLVELTRPGGL